MLIIGERFGEVVSRKPTFVFCKAKRTLGLLRFSVAAIRHQNRKQGEEMVYLASK